MKYIFTFILISIGLFSFGQKMTFSAWQEEAKTNKRLIPKYGHKTKTAKEKESDETFIKSILETDSSRRNGSELLVKHGFNYLSRGDIKTAMFRFNQAWLLDSLNSNVYWGFGTVYSFFSQSDDQIKQYEEGLKLDPSNTNILTDYATVYLGKFYDSSNKFNLYLAIELLRKSYMADPKNYNSLFKLSICYYNLDDCYFAWKYWDECVKFGGMPIMEIFTKDLKKMCTRSDETLDYSIFKTGTFHQNDEQAGLTTIERTESYQIEENIEQGIIIKLKVEWIDESIYKLTFVEDLNPGNIEIPDMTLFCRITEIEKNTYVQVNSADISPMEIKSKIEKIE
ncbi:MAG: hypothetical protein K8R74_08320 [Bacteroidales bacterium]|nr:hypothetical protein [Bacteroidales bacterium]